VDREDLAVGSHGLSSGRDREIMFSRDPVKWKQVKVAVDGDTAFEVSLPRDREMVKQVVDAYFERLNPHRPIFLRHDFERTLDELYDGKAQHHDPGFLCSMYLIFGLGTLSELNHRVFERDGARNNSDQIPAVKDLMGSGWPKHEEFFDCALLVKPDLRVTVSSLQALTLLHWYLYTEVRFYPSVKIEYVLTHINSDREEPSGVLLEVWLGSELSLACTTTPSRRERPSPRMNAS
jgi:hypothetical protein